MYYLIIQTPSIVSTNNIMSQYTQESSNFSTNSFPSFPEILPHENHKQAQTVLNSLKQNDKIGYARFQNIITSHGLDMIDNNITSKSVIIPADKLNIDGIVCHQPSGGKRAIRIYNVKDAGWSKMFTGTRWRIDTRTIDGENQNTYVKLDNIKIHIIDDDKDSSITKMSKNACKQIYQKEVFEKYFPNLDENIYLNAIQKTHDIAAISFILLLEFITQCNPDLTSRLNEPVFDSNDNRLILANHSLKQLNILQENKSNKYDSIGTLLNNCITCMGKRQFMYNLHNPITNKDILNKSYNVTEEFLKHDGYDNNNECFKDYRNIMSGIKDTEKLKRKIIYKKITPKDLYVLYDDLNKILNVCNKTKKNKLIHDYCCKKTNPIKECKKIISELKNTFNIEKCLKIDDLNSDKLSNLDPNDLDIIKKGVNEHIDDHLKDCLDSRIILDAIQNKLSSMISIKENKKNTSSYVKLHTTNKSDPMLIITSRRRTLLKSYIESMNTERRKINIEYKENVSN